LEAISVPFCSARRICWERRAKWKIAGADDCA
jgi:hypothetical protein